MSGAEQGMIRVAGGSLAIRRALQRWALRYAGKLLAKLGREHRVSAELLWTLGTAQAAGTMVGLPIGPKGRRPAQRVERIPVPKLSNTEVVDED